MAPNYSKVLTRNNILLTASAVTLLWVLKNRRKKKTFQTKRSAEDEVKYLISDKKENITKAHVDRLFFKQICELFRIVVPSWASPEAGFLFMIAGSLVARSICDLWIISYGTKIERVFDSEWNNTEDVNEMAKDWKGTIQNIVDGMCPRKEIFFPEIHKANKWITASVLHEMKIRDEKYKVAIATASTENWEEYRKHRKKVVHLVRSNKEEYLRTIIDGNKSNSSELWKNLKSQLKNYQTKQDEIVFNGQKIKEKKDIANRFNEYFIFSIENIIKEIPNQVLRCVMMLS
ncbi:hypothetical protein QE152_g4798 [Popillia japonica]|uniref:Uncharacterized protein n=1 Tax=Popillia japonica TaxID=7064 RepID=A0AAW1MZH1_POPJA